MTSLTDKMKRLRIVQQFNESWSPGVQNQARAHNQALDQCIALVEAEAAVVGDWELDV